MSPFLMAFHLFQTADPEDFDAAPFVSPGYEEHILATIFAYH